MNLSQHTGDPQAGETVNFTLRGGPVSQDYDDNFVGCTRYKDFRLRSTGTEHQWRNITTTYWISEKLIAFGRKESLWQKCIVAIAKFNKLDYNLRHPLWARACVRVRYSRLFSPGKVMGKLPPHTSSFLNYLGILTGYPVGWVVFFLVFLCGQSAFHESLR